MELIDALKWRYAVKKMNGVPVDSLKVEQIITAAHLAPTSSGLQPFEVILVENQQLKEQISPIAFNQSQIIDGSHLLIFAAWDKYTEERIDACFDHMNAERGLPITNSDGYKNNLKAMFSSFSEEQQAAHAAKQAYLAFGVALAAAAELKVDSTPMEGFNNLQLDALLKLDERGLKSTTIMAIGTRAEEGDWLQNLKKVRKPIDKFITRL